MFGMQGCVLNIVSLPENGLYAEQKPAKIWERKGLSEAISAFALFYLFIFTFYLALAI